MKPLTGEKHLYTQIGHWVISSPNKEWQRRFNVALMLRKITFYKDRV